ncbi:MAG TPA: GNAT family N-acetyltransferase [Gemmatimonadaceae bacterium]|nr:GNAT family N-acetyltransferase [Gemmatimonadaceae bacterium]
MRLEIVPFRPEHAAAFYALNRAWLDEHALYEPVDEAQLANPQAEILDAGGAILVALQHGEVVGTAAVIPHGAGEMELAKVTVTRAARGAGLGRRLIEACVAEARARGAQRLVLVSSSKLGSALRLYESMGFVHKPMPSTVPYETADVYMELELTGDPR